MKIEVDFRKGNLEEFFQKTPSKFQNINASNPFGENKSRKLCN